jgi:glycosyltransferase involved in cell wall biosynthesis
MKAELIKRGVPKGRISILYNWCDENHMGPADRDGLFAKQLGIAENFVVMFAGMMGVMQGLDKVLEAAEGLLKLEPRIKFVFVGGGVERNRLERITRERKLTNVVFLERQPVEAMKRILALADVLLVHLKDTALFRITIPSKIQAYMAAGKPVLLGVRGDAADVVRASGCGMVVEPENPKAIADGIIKLYDMDPSQRIHLGSNGREYYETNMSMAIGLDRFERVFQALKL